MARCNDYPPLDQLGLDGCAKQDDVVQSTGSCGVPCGDSRLHPLRMDVDPEIALMDCWGSENSSFGSTVIHYYIADGQAQNIDDPRMATALEKAAALYQETVDLPNYKGPFKLYGSVKIPEKDVEGHQEGGAALDFRVNVTIPRVVVETAGLRVPRHNDIFLMWDLPFFRRWAQPQHEDVEHSGFFFDVLKADIEGFPFSGPEFVFFKLTAKRDTRYAPERRVFGDIPGEDYL